MHNLFPEMMDRPEAKRIVICAVYWLFGIVIFPFIAALCAAGLYDDYEVLAWIQIVCHVLNFLAMLTIFWEYLKDSFFNVQIDVKNFILTVAISVGLMLVAAIISFFAGNADPFSALPVVENSAIFDACAVVMRNPVFGTLCVTLLAPLSVSCMFYALAFSPVCCNHPKVAYLVVALVLMIPRLFNFLWHGSFVYEWNTYLVQLPLHLIACWSYQKTDTIWASIASHAVANLIFSAIILWLQVVGYLYFI